MSGADEGKPKGWYGKAATAERKAARVAARVERSTGKVKPSAATQALREGAARLLARLPTHTRQHTPDIVKQAREREDKRVGRIIAQDRADARKARLRKTALEEVDAARDGKKGATFARHQDTHIGPTPEQIASKAFEPFVVEKHAGSDREVETFRRVSANRVLKLYQSGVFDDDLYPAVLWYQRTYRECEFEQGCGIAAYGERIGGSAFYAPLPRSAAAAEARKLFRFARGGAGDGFALAPQMLPTFDRIVLEEMSIAEAATAGRMHHGTARNMLCAVALALRGRIAHLLPIKAVGAPGGEVPIEHEVEALSAGLPEGTFGQIDPAFRDEDGFMLPWADISDIIRARLDER